jgi:hypothetical protein
MSATIDAPGVSGAPLPVSCRPNISPAGRRRRQRVGYAALGVSIVMVAALAAAHAAWYWRALLFVPSSLSAIAFLQARRNTCIARASEGTFEHDDFSKTKAADDDAAASRHVASGIRRDATLIGLVCGALFAATALVCGVR